MNSLVYFIKDIKIIHSIFALPFALVAVFLLFQSGINISWQQLVKIILCMVMARNVAMGANRILDNKIDALNPRTKNRMIPSGNLKVEQSIFWVGISAAIFIICAFSLNTLAGIFAGPLLLILVGYSSIKRFSYLCHWYLGFCLSLSPIAVSVALTGQVKPSFYALSAAILFWTAGFDLIYSLQDESFDRKQSLFSFPASFGFKRTYLAILLSYGFSLVGFAAFGYSENMQAIFFWGLALIAAILFTQAGYLWHMFTKNEELSHAQLGRLFFDANASISILFMTTVILDTWIL